MTQSAFVRECPLPGGACRNRQGRDEHDHLGTNGGAPPPARRRLRRGVARGQARRPRGRRRAPARLRPRRAGHRQDAPARARPGRPGTPGDHAAVERHDPDVAHGPEARPAALTVGLRHDAHRRSWRGGRSVGRPRGRRPQPQRGRAGDGASVLAQVRGRRHVQEGRVSLPRRCRMPVGSLRSRVAVPAPDEPRRVDATVVDREGGRVALTLAARANGATVSPASDGTSGGDPASFTLTPLPAARTADLVVEGTSNRGRVWGTATGPVAGDQVFLYAVSLSGQGGYTADSGASEGIRHHRDISGFTFTTRWGAVKVPANGVAPPRASAASTRRATTSRARSIDRRPHHGWRPRLRRALAGSQGASSLQLAVGAPAGGASTLTLEGLMPFRVAAGAWACSYDGGFFRQPCPSADRGRGQRLRRARHRAGHPLRGAARP